MFYDLLTRNFNEFFYQEPPDKEKNNEEYIKYFSNNFSQENQTANKLAVNNKKPIMMMMVNDERKESTDKKTPSLEQEMNLARRACWCNNETNGLKSQNQQQKCCENCFNRLNGDNNDYVNNDNDADDENKTTTVMNGANKISKNVNISNNDNNTKTTTTKTINSNSKMSSSNNNTKTTNSLSKRKNINKEHNKENENPTTTTTTSSPKTSNPVNNSSSNSDSSSSRSSSTSNNSSSYHNSISTTTVNNTNLNFVACMRVLLVKMWLAFVEFCDKNTIKSNDPRFAAYRDNSSTSSSSNQNTENTITTSQSKTQQDSTASASSTTSSPPPLKDNTKKPCQFKLLNSKKVIFLLLVCFFFSCINRIEARPNSESTGNAITGDTAAAAPAAASIGDGAAIKPLDKSLTSKASPASESSIPPSDNDIKNYDTHEGPEHKADGEEEGAAHERYPLTQVEFDRVKTPFIIGIWILSASIAKIGFHMTPKLHLIFPESCLLIVVGVVIGVVLFFCTDVAVSPLTPNTFFFYMLPPIILDAGYFMPNRLFFDNLGTILLMAVVGTIFNIATIGGSLWACGLSGIFGPESETPKFLDIFIFASLISAVDPVAVLAVFEEIHVNEILYIVVFGESLLNDAVTVVMYHMMEVYNHIGISEIIAKDVVNGVGSFFVVAVGGTVIGIIWGFLTGLVTRFTDHVRVIEPIFIFVMAYLAYLNAEIFHMSGILSITFCGITMKNYVESNISQKSHTTVKYALKMLSSSSETIIFMFLGVATVNNNHVWNTWFVLLTILFCSVFRVLGIIVLTAMANRFRLHKLSRVDQFVMSYGGLRGAVAFALVLLIDERVVPQKDMFVTTTIAVIYFTVFLQGITIKPLVRILNVKRANKRKPTMNERIHERFMDHLMAGIEDIVGKTGNYNVRDKFKRFDNRFIRPLLIRDLKGAEPKIIETYSKLTMRDAIEVMRRNPSTIGQITGTESMSALFRNYTNNCIGGSPSLTNLDNTCSRNLDMHELDYNPSKKDLTDAKIHHLLAEELKPYRRASIQMHRRLSYSRHAVDDRDLSTQVNYKMQMNFRRMFNDRKHHKRSKRSANKHQEGVKQNHVSFPDFQQNGTTKQFSHAEENPQNKLTEVTVIPPTDDWDDGLTFTAKSSLAETVIPEEDRNLSRDSGDERRVATPTATESTLPWKRQGDELSDAVQQNEFPAWASNKEYLAYNSPSATFLGGINKPKQPKSVIGLFRRESSGSRGGMSIGGIDVLDGAGSARGSDPALAAALTSMVVPSATYNPRLDKRSQSISTGSGSAAISDGHSGPFPITASHRRNVRRGSMLELTGDIIPEESYYQGHSKSLCEPAGEEWDSMLADAENADYASGNSEKLLKGSNREPLLPKLTPRAQIRRGMSGSGGMIGGAGGERLANNRKNPVTTALLSTSNSDYDDDEEEDFDLYDDENIVVTTTTTPANDVSGRPKTGSEEVPTTTTTTIRLISHNDESII